jgi:hypothetical protein
MQILVLLVMYFDAVVVFVTSQTLLFRLALAILCTVRKNCSSDREKLLKFEAEGRVFEFFYEISRTIYSNSERSEQCLVTE